ncbi:MAG: S-layer homology domain-containing protein [Acutalibacter sp.]
MKRKLLATLLALCLIVGMIPVAASAEDGDVAQVGNNTYATLGEAVSNASSGETIKMIADTDISDTGLIVPEEKSLILDINGKKIEASNVPSKNIVVYGDLTIRDSAENSTGKIFTESTYASGGTTALVSAIGENASIILESGFIDAASFTDPANEGQYGLGVMNGGDITITGGKVEAGWYAISGNGNNKTQNSIIVIQGGELISTADYAVYLPHSGETTITGGTIYGAAGGISIQRGTLDISGDALITSKGTGDTGDWGDGTGGQGCAALNIAGEYGDCAVQISGGTLTAEQDALIVRGNNENNKVLEITGGSFSSDVSEYVADGYTMVESESGYTVEILSADNAVAQVEGDYFASLDSAFAAAEEGSTVQLLRNTTYNNRINVEEDVILDLGGYTLTSETSHSFVVYPSKSFTIQNGTIRNTIGTVVFVLKGSTITLDENATLECKDGVSGTNNTDEEGGATFNIYGDIQSTDIAVWIQGPKNTVNIDGADLSANYFAVYQNGSFGGNTYTIRNSTIFNGEEAGPAIYISNSKTNTENENQGWQTLTVEDSTITGPSGIEVKFTNATISNSTITATAEEPTFDQYNNGSTSGGFAVVATDNTMEPNDPAPEGTIEINGGYYSGLVGLGSIVDLEEYPDFKETTYEIHSGNFTSDPSEYLADGLITVPSTVDGYNYTVADKEETSAEVSVAAPNVAKPVAEGTEGDRALANAVYSALTDSESTTTGPSIDESALKAAANAVANDTNGTVTDQIVEDLKQATSNENITANNVTIVIQPYLDIQITDVDATSGSETITLDVTPMYRTVATTANLSEGFDDEIILSGEEDVVNAVQIGTAQPLTVNNTVTVTIPLPKNFAQGGDELFVRHVKSDNRVYFYTGSVEDNVLTFTNPNGFSEMTISKTNGAVAEVEGIGYANFQDAVDAVENGGTIEVLKSGDYSVSGNKTFSITYGAGIAVTLKAATGYVLTQEGNDTYTIAYAGGGTPSEPEEPTWPFEDVTEGEDWFYDAVAYVYENGIMAGTGETTFAPYMELDRAMAAQLFYNLEGKPTVTGDSTFTDVTSGHWAVDAITWAAQNDIVAGIGGGLYDPDSNVTREQFAVMLYKYARFKGYDLTATGDLTQFPDAGSISSWAETALSWANGKGLINGHENGTIDPKGSTIRAQAASIMANFDQNVAK